jgi:hypothetical protein
VLERRAVAVANVYLFDLLHAVGDRPAVVRQLHGYFQRLKAAGGPEMLCLWWYWDPDPSDLDILVYFLPFNKSVVRKLYPKSPDPLGGHHGLTNGANPRVSEVYVKTTDPDLIAKLAFHEIMHMKLRMGNEMHDLGGLASAVVTPETTLTPNNIELMKPALSKPVKQWAGGVTIMAKTAHAQAAGDPLSFILE